MLCEREQGRRRVEDEDPGGVGRAEGRCQRGPKERQKAEEEETDRTPTPSSLASAIQTARVARSRFVLSTTTLALGPPPPPLPSAGASASRARATHFAREPSSSWFTRTYPRGVRCSRVKRDFPAPGGPTRSRSSRAAEGEGEGKRGVLVGVKKGSAGPGGPEGVSGKRGGGERRAQAGTDRRQAARAGIPPGAAGRLACRRRTSGRSSEARARFSTRGRMAERQSDRAAGHTSGVKKRTPALAAHLRSPSPWSLLRPAASPT